MHIPELITEKFTLRPLREADSEHLVALCTDPLIIRWTTVPLNYTLYDAHNFLAFTREAAAQGKELTWGIDNSGVLAGVIALRLPQPGCGSLGFYLGSSLRGRGIMTEAVRVVLGYGFDPLGLGLDTIEWTCQAGNAASERVAVKAGFTGIHDAQSDTVGRAENNGQPTLCDVRTATMTRAEFAAIWR